MAFLATSGRGAPVVTLDSPIGFFTNVGARLLRTELNMDLGRIQVYPTNQYTPAVHRLLQLSANIYDAAATRTNTDYPFLPSFFRPLFRRDAGGSVFIAGYREVTDASLANPATAPPVLDLETTDLSTIPLNGTPPGQERLEPLVTGIPLVIGARTGIPNFNEFSMQTAISVSRLLEFRRAPNDVFGPVVETNQMYVVGITNQFGLEAWNSYSDPYPRELRLSATIDMLATLTNELGEVLLSNLTTRAVDLSLTQNTWLGWTSFSSMPSSFVLLWGASTPFYFLRLRRI